MGLRFSKSFKIGSLLKINISKTGVSATVGKKGASVNIGGKGTYLNLSPSVVGIKGTGLSYRQKLTGGYKDLFSTISKKKAEKEAAAAEEAEETKAVETKKTATKSTAAKTTKKVEEPVAEEENVLVYQEIEPVLTKKKFDAELKKMDDENAKAVYQQSIDGDEDTIESLAEAFMNAVELGYEVNASYELKDHDLYLDLDLPEIETISTEGKDAAGVKETYKDLVLSLGIYMAAGLFNISSYIDRVILSAFTTRRNDDGDQVDDYIYSVKYTRTVFEETDLSKVEDPYKFTCQFENRVNIDVDHTLKKITPYEIEK